MVNIRVTENQIGTDSPKTEVGEIDTRAPFQSVKAAVSLFGEVAISRQKSTLRRSRLSAENVLDKETQLMLAQREYDKIKQKLENAENTRTRALSDLEMAKRTMTDLRNKLDRVNNSKQSAMEAKEAIKKREEQLQHEESHGTAHVKEIEAAREQYKSNTVQLDAAKQELKKLRQDFDSAFEAKNAAIQQGKDAERAAGVNTQRSDELLREISDMKEAIQQLKLATAQNQQDCVKIAQERAELEQPYRMAVEEAENKLKALKQEHDPELARKLEAQLADTISEIDVLREEMKKAHDSEMNSMRIITTELNEATATLQEVADEECSLRSLVNLLRVELEEVRREHTMLNEKEEQRLAIEEQKRLDAIKEESLKLEQMLSEAETARREVEEAKKAAESLKQGGEVAKASAEEAEKRLEIIEREAMEAKAAEKRVHDEMYNLSQKHESNKQESSADSKIKITLNEFETLKRIVEESEKMVQIKLAAIAAQLEEINASKTEADKKLEANLKAIDEIKTATNLALKSAENAESAQTIVEAELQRWRQKELSFDAQVV